MARMMVLVLVGLALVGGAAVVLLVRTDRRRPVQFSLRSMLLAVGLVAIVLSAWLSWRRWTLAEIVWLDPASPAAQIVLRETTIAAVNGRYQAAFRPRHRSVRELVPLAEKVRESRFGMFSMVMRDEEQQADFECDDRLALEQHLAAMHTLDGPAPGGRVIHGLVEDAAGRPVGGAIVDLMGRYVYINHFRTRGDGTFTMPIQAPAGSGYYLRIRVGERRVETSSFALEEGENESLMRVRLP